MDREGKKEITDDFPQIWIRKFSYHECSCSCIIQRFLVCRSFVVVVSTAIAVAVVAIGSEKVFLQLPASIYAERHPSWILWVDMCLYHLVDW